MKIITFAVLCFAAGLFAVGVSAQTTKKAESGKANPKLPKAVLLPQLWNRIEFQSPPECDDWPEGCAKQFLRSAGIELSGSPKINVYRVGEREVGNLTVVLVTTKVDDDDSVSGIRYRLAMSLGDVEDNTFKLETLGRQFTCWRGSKTWTKNLCP